VELVEQKFLGMDDFEPLPQRCAAQSLTSAEMTPAT
jgi:hypothetical protein